MLEREFGTFCESFHLVYLSYFTQCNSSVLISYDASTFISYEPIQGLVKGPAEFLEGIESGTSSLARGVITGLVRGAARYVVGIIVE